MSTAVMTELVAEVSPRSKAGMASFADTAFNAATRFWFVVAVIGQLIFAFAVASFYGVTTLRGDLHRWSKFISRGHVSGDTMGNLAIAVHVASAVIVLLAGALQLIPQVRKRFPVFHRWNGRIYLLAAVSLATAGLYMTWIRGTVGDLPQRLGVSLDAVLIY